MCVCVCARARVCVWPVQTISPDIAAASTVCKCLCVCVCVCVCVVVCVCVNAQGGPRIATSFRRLEIWYRISRALLEILHRISRAPLRSHPPAAFVQVSRAAFWAPSVPDPWHECKLKSRPRQFTSEREQTLFTMQTTKSATSGTRHVCTHPSCADIDSALSPTSPKARAHPRTPRA